MVTQQKNKNNDTLVEYLSGLSGIALKKVISILEMITTLAEIQYEDTYIQDNIIISTENYKNIDTNKYEVANVLNKIAKNLNVKLSIQEYTLVKDIFNSSKQQSDLQQLEIPLNPKTFGALKIALNVGQDILGSGKRIHIYIEDYLIYRNTNKKPAYKIISSIKKRILDYLLRDEGRRVLRDELAIFAMKTRLPTERQKTQISRDIRDINEHFRKRLEFPLKIDEFRLISRSDKQGYKINNDKFKIHYSKNK